MDAVYGKLIRFASVEQRLFLDPEIDANSISSAN